MEIDKFVKLAEDLRKAQKDYFAGMKKEGAHIRLMKAKDLEKQMDDEIDKYKQAKTPKLF